ncbi:MAG: hypothetical protein AAGJ52_04425 [Pseudomonadota bacterium]
MLSRIALVLALLTPVLHVVVLFACADNRYQDPIAVLSQARWGQLHTLALILFGTAQIILAWQLGGLDRGWFWQVGRALLALAGAGLFAVAWFFATAPMEALQGPEANDPLWVVASLVGFAMGCLQLGFNRLSSGLARFNAVCLVLWLLLIPAILLIGVISLGTYERSVGLVYVVWVAGLGVAVASFLQKRQAGGS